MQKPINGFYVYAYHHDDDPRGGWIPLEKLSHLTPSFSEKLSATLKSCGWEGDGKLEGMMIPPFFSEESTNRWFPIFHVKQSNNGTSWIASEYPLSVEDLNAELPRALFEEAKAGK